MRSRSSSTSSGSSYSLEPTDWFSQIGHTSADFNVHSSPITSLPSSQTSMTDGYSLSCSSSSSGSDHSDHYLDPMDISHPYSHEYPLLSLPKFSLSLELPTYHSTEQLGEEEFSALRSSPCQAARERIHSPYHEETINMNALHVSDPLDEMAQFEPGSSASTIRASPLKNNPHIAGTQKPTRSQSRRRRGALTAEMWIKGSNTGLYEEPAVDGGDYARGRSMSANGLSSGNAGGGGYSGRAYSTGGRSVNGSVGGSGSGGHGGDDGDDGNKRNRRFMPGSFAAFSNESDEDEGDESADEDDYGLPSGLPPQNRSRSDDDDVPLARSIPTALKAQQSIRMKDREARDKRRKEREARAIARSQQRLQQQATTSSPPLSSSHDASKALRRPVDSTSQTPPSPFPIDDLTKRLENVQTRGRPDSRSTPLSVGGAASSEVVSPKDGPSAAPARTLRPMRSFHKPEPKKTKDDLNAHPLPTGAEAKLTRSTTRARARSTASREDHPGNNTFQVHTVPIPAPPDEPTTAKLERKRTVKTTADGTRSARTSTEHSRPPLPGPADVIARQNHAKATLTQQRIFIGDRQRFVVVEISHSTTAGDVVRMVEAQGALKEWRGTGGWMLFEIAQDFGMERPIRSFELLTDIEASWNKDKLVNTFLLKLTSLASTLSRSALPSSSPTHSGYIEWESKRGKWNKRYLMLKEHSLWLSKRDNGRDEIMLCSLSNFDAYQITRLVKAPKEFTFAVKSTDNLSFFENTADYLHIFSCKKDAGEKWMEKILLARSYILHQERNILSKASSKGHPKSLPPPQTGSTGLSRSLTKRAGPTLVNVNPANVFEPGSLLRG
ncbi:hypothetical protein GGU10DRAFT_72343 [Lentinula aff. detonsa]|uniref:PH domain-containing protein n=1 Tax=Lentinula aff. detonsa TaxID=2804958 RepID=A0AA38U532_9AGAR|nr:hypothetical protein GGU10DRAFT_72343 [Lentinula aff. detonsa]